MMRRTFSAPGPDSRPYPVASAITPRDDAFHGLRGVGDVEWWYFDALLDGGDSVHLGVRTFHTGTTGIVRSRITFYKGHRLDLAAIKTTLFRDFTSSPDAARIALNGKPAITFDVPHYQNTGEWRYRLTMEMADADVDLTFTGVSPGWKMETWLNSWVVPLPMATVEGTMTIRGEQRQVSGTGYHDHNWDYPFFTQWLRSTGWYWGRIIGDKVAAIWAKTIDSKGTSRLVLILNRMKDNGSPGHFFTVPPEHISFAADKFTGDGQQCIPTRFCLRAADGPSNLPPFALDLTMDAQEWQHDRIFVANYWRYHVATSGTIVVGDLAESLQRRIHIIERLAFQPMHGV